MSDRTSRLMFRFIMIVGPLDLAACIFCLGYGFGRGHF